MLKNRLKELRARDGLNQTDLAKLVGVSRQTISLLERDEYTPSIIIALKISQIFNETVESVFRLEGGRVMNKYKVIYYVVCHSFISGIGGWNCRIFRLGKRKIKNKKK